MELDGRTPRSRQRPLWICLMIAVCVGSVGIAQAQVAREYRKADLKALERAFVKLAEEIRPSVVAIRTYFTVDSQRHEGEQVRIPNSQGSGFVIDEDGYIATNFHVVEDADLMSVILHDGRKLEAEIVQVDRRRDLAVLKVDSHNLVAARLGNYRAVKVNQWTFAAGNPFGLGNDDGNTSVTFGVVSALNRRMTRRLVGDSEIEYYGDLIETSSTINPGNSGGALFNIDGEVIGIVTAIETSSGVSEGAGFAIPLDKNTKHILETLKSGKEMRYGFMGVIIRDVPPLPSRFAANVRGERGAIIEKISAADGPAAKAGLASGDVVMRVDSELIKDSDHLVRVIQFKPVGSKVALTYLRKGVKRKTIVTLGDRIEMLE